MALSEFPAFSVVRVRGGIHISSPNEVATVTAAAISAALSARHIEPQKRPPSHGPAISYVDPINVGWISLHSALDQTNDAALGGSEAAARA